MGTRGLGSPNPNNPPLKPTILAYETALVAGRVYSFSIVGKRCKRHDTPNGQTKKLNMVQGNDLFVMKRLM